ncbi:hypothetical protein V8E51_016445 [Hyaloscypha variabilis]
MLNDFFLVNLAGTLGAQQSFDYIILGGGIAVLTISKRLAEDKTTPAGDVTFVGTEDWGFYAVPDPASDSIASLCEGKCLGESCYAFANVTITARVTRSPILTWDNINTYVENVIRQAYLGAWDSLYQTFDDPTVTNSMISTAIPTELRIQASVSNARVFSWLGVSSLILVSGLLLEALLFFALKTDVEVIEEVKKEGKDSVLEILSDMASVLA